MSRTASTGARRVTGRLTGGVQATRSFVARTLRAMKLAARDSRVPRPLRWIAGIGLLPIPGPVDEALLLLVAPILLIFYREPMRDAWQQAFRSTRPAGNGPQLDPTGGWDIDPATTKPLR